MVRKKGIDLHHKVHVCGCVAYVVCMARARHRLCFGSRPVFTRELVTDCPLGELSQGLTSMCSGPRPVFTWELVTGVHVLGLVRGQQLCSGSRPVFTWELDDQLCSCSRLVFTWELVTDHSMFLPKYRW